MAMLVPEHPWIGEDLHPDLGYWVARDKMPQVGTYAGLHLMLCLQPSHLRVPCRWNMTGPNRGYKYNHSTFNDLIITGTCWPAPQT